MLRWGIPGRTVLPSRPLHQCHRNPPKTTKGTPRRVEVHTTLHSMLAHHQRSSYGRKLGRKGIRKPERKFHLPELDSFWLSNHSFSVVVQAKTQTNTQPGAMANADVQFKRGVPRSHHARACMHRTHPPGAHRQTPGTGPTTSNPTKQRWQSLIRFPRYGTPLSFCDVLLA